MSALPSHRTRALESGAEKVFTYWAYQKHLWRFDFGLRYLPQAALDETQAVVKGGQHSEQQNIGLKTLIIQTLASRLPNIFLKILEILYNGRTLLPASRALSKAKFDNDLPTFIYERYAYFGFALTRLTLRHQLPPVLEVNTTCLDYDVREIRIRWLAR